MICRVLLFVIGAALLLAIWEVWPTPEVEELCRLTLGFLPVLAVASYIYPKYDAPRHGPGFLALGVVAYFPIGLFQASVVDVARSYGAPADLVGAVGNAVVQQLATFIGIYWHQAPDDRTEVLHGMFFALGAALAENMRYYTDASRVDLVLRAFIIVPLAAFTGGIVGAGIARPLWAWTALYMTGCVALNAALNLCLLYSHQSWPYALWAPIITAMGFLWVAADLMRLSEPRLP